MSLSALTEHWQNRRSLADIVILSATNSSAGFVAINVECIVDLNADSRVSLDLYP